MSSCTPDVMYSCVLAFRYTLPKFYNTIIIWSMEGRSTVTCFVKEMYKFAATVAIVPVLVLKLWAWLWLDCACSVDLEL